jgi:hypothetical protein
MHITITGNGSVNGKVYFARWASIGPDTISLAVGSTTIQIPAKPGSTEVQVVSPNGVLLGTDDVELRVRLPLDVKIEAHGRLTVESPEEGALLVTAWGVRLAEPDPEEAESQAEVQS